MLQWGGLSTQVAPVLFFILSRANDVYFFLRKEGRGGPQLNFLCDVGTVWHRRRGQGLLPRRHRQAA